jgi:hypothetical protein
MLEPATAVALISADRQAAAGDYESNVLREGALTGGPASGVEPSIAAGQEAPSVGGTLSDRISVNDTQRETAKFETACCSEEQNASGSDLLQKQDSIVNQSVLAVATRSSDKRRGDDLCKEAENHTGDNSTSLVSNINNEVDREFARLCNISTKAGEIRDENKGHVDFANAQLTDSLLRHAWTLARSGETDRYLICQGLLYEKTQPWVRSDCDKLLIVPSKYRQSVLQAAHDDIKEGVT